MTTIETHMVAIVTGFLLVKLDNLHNGYRSRSGSCWKGVGDVDVHQRFTLLMHVPGLTLQSHQVQSSAQSSMHTCTVCGQTFKLPTAGCILRSGQSLAHTHAACTIAQQAQADRQADGQTDRQSIRETAMVVTCMACWNMMSLKMSSMKFLVGPSSLLSSNSTTGLQHSMNHSS